MKGNRSMQDMTEGRPISLILKFFFPLLFGMLFQQFYNLVDTAIVGKFLGPDDLAAVGATGSVNFLILGFCMGVCNGFSIPVAQKFGAKDESGLRRFVANSVWLSVIFAAVMTVVVCILCRQILIWMDTPANILEGSYRYIFVIFLGIPTHFSPPSAGQTQHPGRPERGSFCNGSAGKARTFRITPSRASSYLRPRITPGAPGREP